MSEPTVLVNGEPLAGPLPLFQRWGRDGVRDGRKTQTRRRVKPQPHVCHNGDAIYKDRLVGSTVAGRRERHYPELAQVCRYGQAGEVRYLREPLCRAVLHGRYIAIYADTESGPVRSIVERGAVVGWRWKRDKLPHQFMPREAARTFVKLTGIRCERVRDITEADAKAEGVDFEAIESAICAASGVDRAYSVAFARVWDDIRGEGAWLLNEWVFVPAWELLDSPKVEVQS